MHKFWHGAVTLFMSYSFNEYRFECWIGEGFRSSSENLRLKPLHVHLKQERGILLQNVVEGHNLNLNQPALVSIASRGNMIKGIHLCRKHDTRFGRTSGDVS